ncbi:MAG: YciI family protein [Ancalomicrobiaceae bacterium]|nr:YciI family protein [Ancalomicrobiaceae bacterium]
MYFISSTYAVAKDRIEALLPAHRAWLDRHYAAGDFLMSGRLDPPTGGFMLARAMPRSDLERLLESDPFRQQGCLTHQIQALVPLRVHETWPPLETLA